MPRARHDRGFTLIELAVVLLIVVILSSLALSRTSKQNAQTASSGLAHEVYAMCQQARYAAMSSGKQVQVVLSARNPAAQLRTALVMGNQLLDDASFGATESQITAHNQVQVMYVAGGVSTTNAPDGLLGDSVARLTFYPSGTLQLADADSTGATIYISDQLAAHPQRVLLYGRTGFAKVLAQ